MMGMVFLGPNSIGSVYGPSGLRIPRKFKPQRLKLETDKLEQLHSAGMGSACTRSSCFRIRPFLPKAYPNIKLQNPKPSLRAPEVWVWGLRFGV